VPLDQARPLTRAERALLDRLLAHVSLPELTKQGETPCVIGTCSCGCPSVALEVEGPAVPVEIIAAHEPLGRDDYMLVQAWGRNAAGHGIDISLHVVFGRLDELEIWARWDGKTAPDTDLPVAETLDFTRAWR
jgi:hypothetical protein